MKHYVTNNYADVSMTSLVGYITTEYNTLVEAFGEPILGSGDGKVSAEWVIKFADGQVATIYDWKTPETPMGTYDWHIGGRRGDVVKRLAVLLGVGDNRWSVDR